MQNQTYWFISNVNLGGIKFLSFFSEFYSKQPEQKTQNSPTPNIKEPTKHNLKGPLGWEKKMTIVESSIGEESPEKSTAEIHHFPLAVILHLGLDFFFFFW